MTIKNLMLIAALSITSFANAEYMMKIPMDGKSINFVKGYSIIEELSDWFSSGEPTCTKSPLESEVIWDKSFTQTTTCTQQEERTNSQYAVYEDGRKNLLSIISTEYREVEVSKTTEEKVGTSTTYYLTIGQNRTYGINGNTFSNTHYGFTNVDEFNSTQPFGPDYRAEAIIAGQLTDNEGILYISESVELNRVYIYLNNPKYSSINIKISEQSCTLMPATQGEYFSSCHFGLDNMIGNQVEVNLTYNN